MEIMGIDKSKRPTLADQYPLNRSKEVFAAGLMAGDKIKGHSSHVTSIVSINASTVEIFFLSGKSILIDKSAVLTVLNR